MRLVLPICESPTIPTLMTTLFFSSLFSSRGCGLWPLGPAREEEEVEVVGADMTGPSGGWIRMKDLLEAGRVTFWKAGYRVRV